MDDSLRKEGKVYRVWDAVERFGPLMGGLLISALVTYTLVEGQYASLFMPGLILIALGVVTLIVPIEWILLLSLAAVILADSYFVADAYFEPEGINYYFTRFVPFGMLAIRSLLALAMGHVRLRTTPGDLLKPFGVFFLLALFSTLYDDINPRMTFLRALTMGFVLVGFGVGVPTYMGDDRKLRRGLHAVLVLLGLVISLGTVTFPYFGQTAMEYEPYFRLRGIFVHPNTLGLMAMLSFFPILGWWHESPQGKRWPLAILMLILLFSLFVSGARASVFGILCGALVFVGFGKVNRRAKALMLVLFATSILLWVGLPDLLPGLVRMDTGWRFQLWSRALELGMQTPLFGVGFGSTHDLFMMDKVYLYSVGIYAGGSHNEYLRLFVGLGFIGLFIVLFAFARVIIKAVRVIRTEKNPILPLSLLAAVVSGMGNAVFEDWIFAFGGAPAFPFWFFLTVLALYTHRYKLRGREVTAKENANKLQ